MKKLILLINVLIVGVTISCQKGEQGDIGPQGIAGVDGKNGSNSTDKGPTGDKGLTGDKGETGLQGSSSDPGATNLIVSNWEQLNWNLEKIVDIDASKPFKNAVFLGKIENTNLTDSILKNSVIITYVRYTNSSGNQVVSIAETGTFLNEVSFLTSFEGYQKNAVLYRTIKYLWKNSDESSELAEAIEQLKSIKVESRTFIINNSANSRLGIVNWNNYNKVCEIFNLQK